MAQAGTSPRTGDRISGMSNELRDLTERVRNLTALVKIVADDFRGEEPPSPKSDTVSGIPNCLEAHINELRSSLNSFEATIGRLVS